MDHTGFAATGWWKGEQRRHPVGFCLASIFSMAHLRRSIKSNISSASKKQSLISLKSGDKNRSTDTLNINRAIPGPGDEIEAEPDAGVVEKEKVSVVFLVSSPSIRRGFLLTTSSASRSLIIHLYQLRITDVLIRASRRMEWIKSRRECRGCVRGLRSRLTTTLMRAAVRVGPGPSNKGIFIRIAREGPGEGEVRLKWKFNMANADSPQEYRISHPSAQVNGILKGSYYGTISDQISITCHGTEGQTKLRALVDYKDEVCYPVFATMRSD